MSVIVRSFSWLMLTFQGQTMTILACILGIGYTSYGKNLVLWTKRIMSARGSKFQTRIVCFHIPITDRHVFWGSSIASNPPSVHYDEIMADDKGVGKWTETIVSPVFHEKAATNLVSANLDSHMLMAVLCLLKRPKNCWSVLHSFV